MLDNNTQSSVSSRFHNKVFNGEVIVITSSVPLHYWFRGKDGNGNYYNVQNEDFNQLYRRISCYVKVCREEIEVYHEVDRNGHPAGLASVFKNELAEIKQEERPKRDFGALFGAICEPSRTDVFDKEQLEIKTESGENP